MVQLPREYKDTTPTWLPLLLAGVFGAIGFFALCYGIGSILLGATFQARLLSLGLGAGFLVMGIACVIQLHWNYVKYSIQCTPVGFSVLGESKRRGARREEFRWNEVTKTSYEEVKNRSGKQRRTTQYFSVETTRGRAFKVNDYQSGFDELIAVFNEQTPHLPYVWALADEGSFANTMLRAVTRASKYNQVQRPPPAMPPPPPPPLSTALPPPLPPLN